MVFKRALLGIMFESTTNSSKAQAKTQQSPTVKAAHSNAPAERPLPDPRANGFAALKPIQRYEAPWGPHHGQRAQQDRLLGMPQGQTAPDDAQTVSLPGQYLIQDSMSRQRIASGVRTSAFSEKNIENVPLPPHQSRKSAFSDRARWA